ncbi:tetratricopeptide repeat protein [Leptolyngbya sp. KIOST-1]|uniref:tetratricopeptide repeat protein n=1 Tax=Leptolyngbya sp. KIOST-1 TaxID=1229172 RepID=UPI000A926EFF|nr:tetratricopeptide repeat protein [Leptolyngbya sp. KIOST-1]
METCVRDRLVERSAAPRPAWLDGDFECLRLNEMGQADLEKGRYQEALTHFEQALRLDPHRADSWCHRAEALSCLSRYAEALQSVEQAQALAGLGNPRLWVQKAVLLILLNHPKQALTCCNQALWRSPGHAQAWLFRGVALHRLGLCKAAYRSYQRVLKPEPGATQSLRKLCRDLALDPQA